MIVESRLLEISMRYLVFLCFISLATAQTPAGGKWTLTAVKDQMTDAKSEQFTLSADAEVIDSGLKTLPTLSILCSGTGRFNSAQLQTGILLSVPDDSAHYKVRVRLDNKFSDQFWDRYEDAKTLGLPGTGIMGKHWLKAILKASDVRIQFSTLSGYSVVVQFSPAGLDREILARSCGLK
jgi:hypothetical protein